MAAEKTVFRRRGRESFFGRYPLVKFAFPSSLRPFLLPSSSSLSLSSTHSPTLHTHTLFPSLCLFLFLFLSFSLISTYLSTSIYLSQALSISVFLCLSISLSLSFYLSFSCSLCLSISFSLLFLRHTHRNPHQTRQGDRIPNLTAFKVFQRSCRDKLLTTKWPTYIFVP
jgi:hypothetical protein